MFGIKMKKVVIVLYLMFVSINVSIAEINYDYYEYSFETAKADDESLTGKAFSFTRGFVNDEDIAIEFQLGLASITEINPIDETTETQSYASLGAIYHPTVFSGFDVLLGGFVSILDLGLNNPNQESFLGYRIGFRYEINQALEFASHIEKLDASDSDEPAFMNVSVGYQMDKHSSIKLKYSLSSDQDNSETGVGVSYVYYIE